MPLKKTDDKMIDELFALIASLESSEDIRALFRDLCTDTEIRQMAQRIHAAKLLIAGKTYNQVIEETDISSATLSRVSRCVRYGNGYSRFLKIPEEKTNENN